jgi:hypothetical protein
MVHRVQIQRERGRDGQLLARVGGGAESPGRGNHFWNGVDVWGWRGCGKTGNGHVTSVAYQLLDKITSNDSVHNERNRARRSSTSCLGKYKRSNHPL